MSSFYTSFLLILFGFTPSLVWLFYYLKKDCHPEPKSMIAKTMAMGIVLAPLAIASQWLFAQLVILLKPGYAASTSVTFFLWAAFVEEFVKFLAIKFTVLHSPEFDEPTDGMIYMISAALGFAAIENILVLFQASHTGFNAAAQILLLRFVGATLLHAVSAAVTGYFLALAWFYSHHSQKLITAGLAIATIFHFTFNLLLLTGGNYQYGFLSPSLALFVMAVMIAFLFTKLRERLVC